MIFKRSVHRLAGRLVLSRVARRSNWAPSTLVPASSSEVYTSPWAPIE